MSSTNGWLTMLRTEIKSERKMTNPDTLARECRNCQRWTRANLNDETAPEGYCRLRRDPGFWPFGYWPATLARDGCGRFEA